MRAGPPSAGVIVSGIAEDEPTTEQLKRQQLEQEEVERERLADPVSEADADRHRRRAEKASYLRQKLEERERSEREAADAAEGAAAAEGEEGEEGDPGA